MNVTKLFWGLHERIHIKCSILLLNSFCCNYYHCHQHQVFIDVNDFYSTLCSVAGGGKEINQWNKQLGLSVAQDNFETVTVTEECAFLSLWAGAAAHIPVALDRSETTWIHLDLWHLCTGFPLVSDWCTDPYAWKSLPMRTSEDFFKVITCGQSTVISLIIHSQNFPLFCTVVELLSHVGLFATPLTAARQAPLSFTVSWNLLKFMSIESVILSSATPFSFCFPSFPASESFPESAGLFSSGGQSIGASVSVLPMNVRIDFL